MKFKKVDADNMNKNLCSGQNMQALREFYQSLCRSRHTPNPNMVNVGTETGKSMISFSSPTPLETQWWYIGGKLIAQETKVDVSLMKRTSRHLLHYTFLADTLEPKPCDIVFFFAIQSFLLSDATREVFQKDASIAPICRWFQTIQQCVGILDNCEGLQSVVSSLNRAFVERNAKKRVPREGAECREKGKPLKAVPDSSQDFAALHLIVGKIVSIEKHTAAENLYVEQIDLGEPLGKRQIISGLVKWMPIQSLQDCKVVVLCNLKPAKLVGVESQGMVMCVASNDGNQLELLQPPVGSRVGDVITLSGSSICSSGAPPIPSKKLSDLLSKLSINTKGEVHWKPSGQVLTVRREVEELKLISNIIEGSVR